MSDEGQVHEGEVVEEEREAPPPPPEDEQAPARSAAATKLKIGPEGIEFSNVQEMVNYATACFRSGMLPEHIKRPEHAFVIMANGLELGLKPWASWKGIYISKQGRIQMQSKTALAVVQSKPSFGDYEERIELEGTAEMRAVAFAARRGKKPTTKEFSLKDAEVAGLLRKPTNRRNEVYDGPYQKFLKDMLLARARDRALSIAFAAELAGITLETMGDDAEPMERERAGRAPAQPVGPPPAGDLEMGAPPKQIAAGGPPDPLLMSALSREATPAPNPFPEPTAEERELISRQVDEVFGEPGEPPPPADDRPRYKVGDIVNGNRRVLSVTSDGHIQMAEALTKEEMAALKELPKEAPRGSSGTPAAPAAPAEPSETDETDEGVPGKPCPRDYCGAPLNLIGACDQCGWPTSNLLKERGE